MLIKYYSAAGGEGGDGDGSGSGAPKTAPKIQKLTDEQVNVQVSGLKNKNNELFGKLKESTKSLKCFEGIDLDAVKTIPQHSSDDEKAQLIAAGRTDEMLDKRTERLRADVDKQIKTANGRAEKTEAFSNRLRNHTLDDAIRSATLKASALPEASDDPILRAKGTFRFNDEGEAVAVDINGGVLFGRDGKAPFTLVEWAELLKEMAPHLFPRAEGSGADGYRPDGGGGGLKRSGMGSSDKMDYIREHGQQACLKSPKQGLINIYGHKQ